MLSKYQSLVDLLNPKKEELMTPIIQPEPETNMSLPPAEPEPSEAMSKMSQEQMDELNNANEQQTQQLEIPDNTPMDQVLRIPQLSDILPPKQETANQEQPQTPMLAQAIPAAALAQETPLSRLEALMQQYRGEDQKSLEEARRRDRMLKVGGALGDALATYLNARSQMNVKAPGVQVQQGAGLGKVADMFATAPEIASDVKARREALMKQYAELSKGERTQLRLKSEEQREKNRLATQEKLRGEDAALKRELAKAENEAMLKAAGIRASAKEQKKKELTPYQEKQIERQERKEAKLSDKQTTELEGINNVLKSLDEVETAKAGVNTGRYISAIQSGKEALPFSEADQDFVKLRQLSGTQLFDYVKNQSGVSYSVKELEQLKNNMPNVEDDDNTFMTKLKTVRGIVERKQKEKLSAFEKQGKNVSEFKQEQPVKKASAGDIVNVKGKKYRVAEDGDTLIPVGQ